MTQRADARVGPCICFDTLPILRRQMAACFVVGYKYPPAVDFYLIFTGGSAMICAIQYFLDDACRRTRERGRRSNTLRSPKGQGL